MNDNQRLAQLLVEKCGWDKDTTPSGVEVIWNPNAPQDYILVSALTSPNALHKVYTVLDERMLWGTFIEEHGKTAPIKRPFDDLAWWAWWFLRNPETQVKAMIKILEGS